MRGGRVKYDVIVHGTRMECSHCKAYSDAIKQMAASRSQLCMMHQKWELLDCSAGYRPVHMGTHMNMYTSIHTATVATELQS